MSKETSERLMRSLPLLVSHYGTPFGLYDYEGMLQRGLELKAAMKPVSDIIGFQQHYAVKAWPNPANLKLQHRNGFGFDCSSPFELELANGAGARGEEIFFTSNNTQPEWFDQALQLGAVINLDDISLIDKMPYMPELICFRINPGNLRVGTGIIGKPIESKYGIMWEEMIKAYRKAKARGAKRFGIHMMVASNSMEEGYIVDTAKMLLTAIKEISCVLKIRFEFMNIGGGFGTPYLPGVADLDVVKIGRLIANELIAFSASEGYVPKLYTELGRWMTGPFGVLVVKVINRKNIYQTHIGVDAGMEAMARHAAYGAYHHVTKFRDSRDARSQEMEIVNIVGSICENCDRLATQIELPVTKMGDILIIHNTGAHGTAMCGNYNSKTRIKEVMIHRQGAELIRRAETHDDLMAMYRFKQDRLHLA
ncbi:MAG: diaminopimelate decarboxylase [bacterium]